MEALFLLLIAAVLFIQAWYLVGFADPRTMGLIAGALAVGLLLTAATAGLSTPLLINPTTVVAVTAMKGFVLLWAVYAAALAAHGLGLGREGCVWEVRVHRRRRWGRS